MFSIEKAEQYIAERNVATKELPVFHVAPPIGWMNDPNGFSIYRGEVHLFYQFHPYSEVWGPMHWGHCASKDFVKWERLPVAMAPDCPFDEDGCFSGSGMEISAKDINCDVNSELDVEKLHVLAYTGVANNRQNQCIAIGDGKTYRKLDINPVINGDLMPENFSREDFRDPKLWKEEDGYYMSAGNKTYDGTPQVVLFHSADLKNWDYVSVLAADTEHTYGSMWECPDFFAFGDKHALLFSPQDMPADEVFHNGNNVALFIGDYKRDTHEFQYEKVFSVDDGLDFYAPQTLLAADGRRIMIGWMQSWDSNIRPRDQKWACMMTLPREIKMQNGLLVQQPVRELANYYADSVVLEKQAIKDTCTFQNVSGRVLDLSLTIYEGDYSEFCLQIAAGERFHTDLIYDKEKQEFEINRTHCGMNRDTIASRRVKIKNPKDLLKLRVVMDRYSAEIFLNDGLQALSVTYYTPLSDEGIRFLCDGECTVDIKKHAIK